MLNTSFAPWPAFTPDEIEAVSDVLRSGRVNYWTGSEGRAFETEFAAYTGTAHAIAVANGTLAIDLLLHGLGIGPGDEVVVTSRTFMASASAIVLAGATPIFADIDRDSQVITPATIAAVLTPRTKAILCVHLAGWPCDMIGIEALAAEHGLLVIEDCAQAHGARIGDRPVGSFGAGAAWSFCQDKIMSTGGEGGMVTTNDPALWDRMWSYKDHGKSWQAVHERQHPPGFRWLHETFGTNWRLTEMQAAIGRIQLSRLEGWRAARERNALTILGVAADSDILRVPLPPDTLRHAWYKAYAFVEADRLKQGWDRDRLVAEITARGVPCFQGSCSEVYLEKAFQDAGLAPASRLPVARELGETSLMVMVHPTLTEGDIALTCEALSDVCALARR